VVSPGFAAEKFLNREIQVQGLSDLVMLVHTAQSVERRVRVWKKFDIELSCRLIQDFQQSRLPLHMEAPGFMIGVVKHFHQNFDFTTHLNDTVCFQGGFEVAAMMLFCALYGHIHLLKGILWSGILK